MSKYLDKDGLVALWAKIKNTFATSADLNAVVDEAPVQYNTLKKIANWIENYGDTSEITEMINQRKLYIIPIGPYNFNTNLRVNQVVQGSSLVDAVIEETNIHNRQVVIQVGDYKFNVSAILESHDYRGFSIMGSDLTLTDEHPFPALEKCVFLYSVSMDKTYTFYEKAFNNEEINEKITSVLNSTLIPMTTGEIDTICEN